MQLWEATSAREVSPSSIDTVLMVEIEIETAAVMAAVCGSEQEMSSRYASISLSQACWPAPTHCRAATTAARRAVARYKSRVGIIA